MTRQNNVKVPQRRWPMQVFFNIITLVPLAKQVCVAVVVVCRQQLLVAIVWTKKYLYQIIRNIRQFAIHFH